MSETEFYHMYPIRCITCNGPIERYKSKVLQMKEEGIPMYIILDTLGIKSYCCRIALMTPICLAFETENRNIVNGKENASTEDLIIDFLFQEKRKLINLNLRTLFLKNIIKFVVFLQILWEILNMMFTMFMLVKVCMFQNLK